ncbi:MAG: hypothetical protein KKB38_20720, partial [Gammaproteobacteria bacterium]|nr:hypothetical protein [Gammaproteobacteria bacterium]
MSDPLFYIEIQDASGNAVGDRPIRSAIRVSRSRSLDKIGGLQFSLPAVDPATEHIRTGRRFMVTHRHLGNLGTFIYKNERLSVAETPILNVDCWDDLKELVDTNVLLFREYSNTAVNTVV